MKLSVCIATYNEKANIHYALDSVIDWVDEVVIVDGESTDGTPDWVARWGAKVRVISQSNPPIFHINKQKALDAAQGEWILQLDADEEIPPALAAEIRTIVEAPYDAMAPIAYQIPRNNYFLGRFLLKGGVYPDYTVRLYRRGSVYFPCKDVHENVVPSAQSEIPVPQKWLGTLAFAMNHYSDPTFKRYLLRWRRYNAIEAGRVMEKAHAQYPDSQAYRLWRLRFVGMCFLFLPLIWFVRTYVRHKGFMDGWQGLVFHTMSAVRWWGIGYIVLKGS